MKHLYKLSLLLLALLLPANATAHDFEVDGIYYNINGNEATVTYRGTDSSQYSDEYSGDVIIPSTVTFNGTTFSVTSIGHRAFKGCTGLTRIDIPNSVTTIGSSAFSGCIGLTSIEIPNSVTTIGSSAFYNTPWYNNQPDGLVYAGLVAYKYKGSMPNGTSITLRNGTLGIAGTAFSSCSNLTNIIIPNTVSSIGASAFASCSGLTSIIIPNSVSSIGDYAFSSCSGLTSITVASSNPKYDSRNNCNAIIETASNTLIAGCKNSFIPNSVTSICDYAFYGCSGLTTITIPNSVTTIGNYAFSGCHGLTSIIIGNSVTSIGDRSFESCRGLTSITIPNSVTSIGNSAFSYCTGLTSIQVESGNPCYDSRNNSNAIIETASNKLIAGCKNTIIPNSVTSIGWGAFLGCGGLTSITIPNSVTTIGEYAFSDCSGLTSITIPNSVISIGQGAFNRTAWYNNQPDGLVYAGLVAYKYKGTMLSGTSITLRNGTLSLAAGVFSGCTGLTSITIPNSVTSIGGQAFSRCSGLTNISIPSSVTSIGWDAFFGCSGLTSITIPNSVTSIGNYAFYGCSGLTSITIPNSVTIIGEAAFAYCSGLISVTIGNSVASIGYGAFSGCSGLTSIVIASGNPTYDTRNNCNAIIETASNTLLFGCQNTIIPNSVASIGNSAFYGCSSLSSVTIPNTVTSIGYSAFRDCSSLTDIFSLALVPPTMYDDTFYGSYDATLYVPDIVLESYKAADYWNNFTNIVGMPYTFEVDGTRYHATTMNTASVMANNDEAALYSGEMVIPDSVTYEGMSFAVTGIENNAFDGCFELTSITIPNSVETIGEQAFQGCTGLTSVTIGSGVTAIGAKAFNYCNALETVKCLGTVPPVMASADCFSTAAYNRATLQVPRQFVDAYTAADYWYKFAHIEGWGSAGRGDIDGDGEVSIRDVTTMIDAILTGEHEGVYFESADLNSNGRLDIGDVTSIIDMLLNGE